MAHYVKILKKTYFITLALNGQNRHYFGISSLKAEFGKMFKKLAKLKITGIDRHVLTIIFVDGYFQKSYHLKAIINKKRKCPPCLSF